MSLLIGRHVYWTLANDADVAELTEGRIYPLAAEQGISGRAWCTFEVQTTEPEYTKDGLVCDNHLVTVNCVSPTYDEAIDLAEAVRRALDQNVVRYPEEGFGISDASLRGGVEDYDKDQGFVVTLTFDIESEPVTASEEDNTN